MQLQSLYILLAAGTVFGQPENKKRLNNKCTIGVQKNNAFAFGGSGGNIPSSQAYGFIEGTNGVLTKADLHSCSEGGICAEATGSYGGIGGGDWKVQTYTVGLSNIGDCKVTFRGTTFQKSKVDKGTCDVYHGGSAFKGFTGCRCRFDCQ